MVVLNPSMEEWNTTEEGVKYSFPICTNNLASNGGNGATTAMCTHLCSDARSCAEQGPRIADPQRLQRLSAQSHTITQQPHDVHVVIAVITLVSGDVDSGMVCTNRRWVNRWSATRKANAHRSATCRRLRSSRHCIHTYIP